MRMNPDSNFLRDNEAQILSITASNKMVDEGEVKPPPKKKTINENQHVKRVRNQLEFYMGDANLSKDQYLQRKLEGST